MLYTIKNNFLEVSISDHGAEIKSIKFQDQERLHDSNPTYWGRSAPILFPNVGKLLNNKTIINGKEYTLNGHGFIRDSDFIITNQHKDSIVLLFNANENTLKQYPFLFTMEITYYLIDNVLESTIKVTNNSDIIMPFNLGLHPAFKIPMTKDYQYEDYAIVFPEAFSSKVGNVNLTNGTIDFKDTMKKVTNLKELPLNYDDYNEDALVFDHFKFNELSLVNTLHTEGVTFKFNGFTMLGIWTPYPKKAPFICLEPWCGCADTTEDDGIFEHKRYMIKLEPAKSHEFSYQFKFF